MVAASTAAPATVPDQRARPRPGPLVKVLYGIGEITGSARSSLFGLFGLFFYSTVMGLPGSLVGLAAGIGLIWDALIDPFIGHASDRIRTRWGQRHIFMLA